MAHRKSYTQTQGVFTAGFFSPCLQGYRLTHSDFRPYPSERHETIDDNPAIHREIRQFLATLASPKSIFTVNMSTPDSITTPVPIKETLAYPGKYTEIGIVQYCKDASISMRIRPSIPCNFYATAGGLIWRPNQEGVIDTEVSSEGMNKPLRVWVNPDTQKAITFEVKFTPLGKCN